MHATATVHDSGPLLDLYPGADLVVEAKVTNSFINCPRYITKHASLEPSVNVPDAEGNAPLADWKRIDMFQDVLPARFRDEVEPAGGTLTVDEYVAKVLGAEG